MLQPLVDADCDGIVDEPASLSVPLTNVGNSSAIPPPFSLPLGELASFDEENWLPKLAARPTHSESTSTAPEPGSPRFESLVPARRSRDSMFAPADRLSAYRPLDDDDTRGDAGAHVPTSSSSYSLRTSLLTYAVLALLWGVTASIIVALDLSSLILTSSHDPHTLAAHHSLVVALNVLSFLFYAAYVTQISVTFVLSILDGIRLHDHILASRMEECEFWRGFFLSLRTLGLFFFVVAVLGCIGKILLVVTEWGVLLFYFFMYDIGAVCVALGFEIAIFYALCTRKHQDIWLVRGEIVPLHRVIFWIGKCCSTPGCCEWSEWCETIYDRDEYRDGLCESFWCMFFCGIDNEVSDSYVRMNGIPDVRRDRRRQFILSEQNLDLRDDETNVNSESDYSRYVPHDDPEEETRILTPSLRRTCPPSIPKELMNSFPPPTSIHSVDFVKKKKSRRKTTRKKKRQSEGQLLVMLPELSSSEGDDDEEEEGEERRIGDVDDDGDTVRGFVGVPLFVEQQEQIALMSYAPGPVSNDVLGDLSRGHYARHVGNEDEDI